jgi:biofilm PGA synthesis N-glycosyltransferase PgaC
MVYFIAFFTLAGYNFSFWMIIGTIRLIYEKLIPPPKRKRGRPPKPYTTKDIAAIIPAHNEEYSIRRTIRALKKVLPRSNIFVASDNSTDKTVPYARSMGVKVDNIRPNLGKARALVYMMKKYRLLQRFKAVLINDADREIDRNYMKLALPLFKDTSIAVVAPHSKPRWYNYNWRELLFITYRFRLWRVVQYGMRFGQTWKFTNVSYIVPGSLCLYRTRVLKHLEIDAPGLIIEDFNMTFELHKKKLGKIAYLPGIFGWEQDPYNIRDYIRQIRRWNLGFWQTVKRNGIWPSLFWLSTSSFILELYVYSIFLVFLPALLTYYAFHNFSPIHIPFIYPTLSITDILIGVFAMDYLTTVIVAVVERKPSLFLYGFAFFILRYIDACIYMLSMPKAFLTRSAGTWKSPTRR